MKKVIEGILNKAAGEIMHALAEAFSAAPTTTKPRAAKKSAKPAGEGKKRGRPPMTPEQKAAKKTERAAAKAATPPVVDGPQG